LKKLLLIIGDEKREIIFGGFQVLENMYEGFDTIIEIFPIEEERLEAEGVGKPSSQGIQDEVIFNDVLLHETVYSLLFKKRQVDIAHRILTKPEGYKLVDKYNLSTSLSKKDEIEKCIIELIENEKKLLSSDYFLYIVEPPLIKFYKGNEIQITESVEVYSKEKSIEEASFKESSYE